MMQSKIDAIIEPAVIASGYDYVGSETVGDSGGQILRVYVDSSEGVTIDACAEMSRQISAVLDVEDLFKRPYRLEVSSPGLDRPLFKLQHFIEVEGKCIQCRLHQPLNGRRNFKGVLTAVNSEMLHMLVDGNAVEIDYKDVDKANLVFEF